MSRPAPCGGNRASNSARFGPGYTSGRRLQRTAEPCWPNNNAPSAPGATPAPPTGPGARNGPPLSPGLAGAPVLSAGTTGYP
jgi:hypothetical protein